MVLSEDDKKDLQIVEWPYINPSVSMGDTDEQLLEGIFFKMKARGSTANVNEIIDYITSRKDAQSFSWWIIDHIREIAGKFFPHSDGRDPVFDTRPPER